MSAPPLDVHRVSLTSLRTIAAGNATETELHLLCSAQRSQLLLVLRALLGHMNEAALSARCPGGAAAAEAAWQLLCAAEQEAPEAVEAVLADPTVMAWALRLLRRLGGTADAAPSLPLWADLGQFQTLAAAAALRARIPAELRVPAYRGTVWVPSLGVAGPVARRRWSLAEFRVERGGFVVRGEHAEVRLPWPAPVPAPGWRPLRPVRGAASRGSGSGPWLDTVTPYRDFTQYPKSPGALGERRLRAWEDRLAEAHALLERESAVDAALVRTMVRVLVPRPFQSARGGLVASASSVDAFGAITMSLPYDATQTAAVLVHEARHQQLNALLSLVRLIRAADDRTDGTRPRLHYAPWRSDPRPVLGLLHGTFAFSGVARFWRTHRRHVTGTEAQRADFEFAVLREQLREAVASLAAEDDLTEAGRLFVDELAAQIRDWQGEEVPALPARLGRHYCLLRRAVWRARHLTIDEAAAERLAEAWAAGEPAPDSLPDPVLRPRPDRIRLDTFGPLARYRLSAPHLFERGRRQAERGGDPARRAEYAVIAGDTAQAVRHYGEWIRREPQNAEAWVGAALAWQEHDSRAGASLLLDRPDVVAGVCRAVASARGEAPDPFLLAAWLGGADTAGVRSARTTSSGV
ncbi:MULTISPECIES: aKG-HExxH-type peptide beta-hydroxylase [Streptomyces]|uniref:aKG-HExxH-type peptide beta-hydroxylase n=1 Tax=Streptomyces TaxID=1883 RepID=UPI000B2FDDF4|nr:MULTISPECIES: HEXXH motif-containing putative peptide modification protein [Streptomyces]